MTHPPEDSRPGSEPGGRPDGERGAEHAQPSQPAPPQYGPPQYGQQPEYPQQPFYGQQQPPYGQQPPFGGQAQQPYAAQPPYPQQPQYGQPYPQPQYGQPYGRPGPYGQQPYGQQGPYGQPPYGTYPAQYGGPAKKSRTGLIVGLAVAALVIVVAAVLIPTALSYKVLDRSAVQRDVATQFQQRDGVKIDLTCPQRMKVSTGATYTCTGTTSQGEKVTLHIRITDENTAAYTWSER